jgi:trigger factor
MAENQGTDPAATDTQAAPSVTVENAGPARRKLTIELPESRIKEKFNSDFDELKQEAQLPGFRKGKAPARLLERRFGDALRKQVKGELLNEAFSQAVENEGLQVLGEPDIDTDNIELPDSGPLTFTCEVDIRPEFELPDLSQIEVTKQSAAVADADIDSEIENYRERFGDMQPIENAEVQEGDFIQADVHILAGEDAGEDAEVLEHHPGAYVLVNGEQMDYKGHVAGIVVEDMGKRLPGKTVGDIERISMTGPESHENEKIQSQPITLTLRIDQVQRVEPASVETVAEQAGVESADELRERVKEMLESRKQREQQQDAHRQVTEQLRERVEMELPESLTEQQTEQMLQRKQMQALYSGQSPEDAQQQSEEARAETEQEAKNEIKDHFIIDKAASELGVEVGENEVNQQIYMQAMQSGERPEKMRKQMEERGELQQLYMQLRETKTLDKILEQATVHNPDGEGEASDNAEAASDQATDAGATSNEAGDDA